MFHKRFAKFVFCYCLLCVDVFVVLIVYRLFTDCLQTADILPHKLHSLIAPRELRVLALSHTDTRVCVNVQKD